MRGLRQLVAVEAVAVAALVVFSGAASALLIAGIEERGQPLAVLLAEGFAFFGMFGAPAVVLVGAPAYWALLRRGQVHWASALALGAMPGLVLMGLSPGIGLFYVACGVPVALLTHWGCRQWALTSVASPGSPSASSRPRPESASPCP